MHVVGVFVLLVSCKNKRRLGAAASDTQSAFNAQLAGYTASLGCTEPAVEEADTDVEVEMVAEDNEVLLKTDGMLDVATEKEDEDDDDDEMLCKPKLEAEVTVTEIVFERMGEGKELLKI